MKKILVVCMGNICRSPTGEAVLRKKAQQMDIDVTVDSAGTIGFHQGNPPDSRSKSAGENRGYSFKGITSRKVVMNDFDEFDLILAADKANLDDLTNQCPAHLQYKLALFLSFGESQYQEIPDPYYGEGNGFELVLDLIEESSEAILGSM
ncbi:low molecular weight phosphotyrosine protein phosphatase [Vibrio splendidus]|jgi:protein-tyrosine phosphatase|uniref:low molecular weight protein-tyrosine-phosphatase n=1 Tax=Vibrio TaxID=662 RepID=UPI000975D934|nr:MULTISPECIES: low molecular weight protein-tyrosine-phosphatase [Vibrio]OMO28017.1 protein-tyrosine-phosphatase [Vibrio sp. 10N.222.47.A9]PTO59907.1 low molecular weight phosphotyrosine protein phosphatase [Vibrio splendidus]PTO90389.1 low molecular weight phosphotyrosine protein phosphatase [Vibrio splendidus]PTP04075.1 low molecular weight phosphotyrosine protein phosphatase [Vibrio splendidus]PTP50216.1 low molecular weight phosphotyrosine protein phosphatase [Vibrio splendidus]